MRKIILVNVAIITSLFLIDSCINESGCLDNYAPLPETLSVIFEQPEDTDTKVYTDNTYQVKWRNGDLIEVYDANYSYVYVFSGETGSCSGEVTLLNKQKSSFFTNGNRIILARSLKKNINDPLPSGGGAGGMGGSELYNPFIENTYWIGDEYPLNQTYVEHSFGPDASTMVSATTETPLVFKNQCGFLVIKLYGKDVAVSSLTINSNNNEMMSGDISIIWAKSNNYEPCTLFSSNSLNKTNLLCTNPVSLSPTEDEYKEFWVALPPQEYKDGITITVVNEDGYTFSKSTRKSVTITRNKVTRMAPVEVIINRESTEPEAVDLDLPSGVKWASFDLGATKPGESGLLFSWDETMPKGVFTEQNYQYKQKYSRYGDNLTILELEDDAAHVNLGGEWRTPNGLEVLELLETKNDPAHYQWSKITIDAGKGLVQAIEVKCLKNGNSIIFGTDKYMTSGRCLGYWGNNACFLFSCLDKKPDTGLRYKGLYVRPVIGDALKVESISLDPTQKRVQAGKIINLKATTNPRTDILGFEGFDYVSDGQRVLADARENLIMPMVPGEATIELIAYDGFRSTDTIIVEPYSFEKPEKVDLGLPSGIRWASFNLGASAPEDNGCMYLWGDPEPYDPLTWSDKQTLVKGKYKDTNDLLIEDDAATKSLGEGWRLPTKEDYEELVNFCTRTKVTISGRDGYRDGYRYTSKENGNSIFFVKAFTHVCSYAGYTSYIQGEYMTSRKDTIFLTDGSYSYNNGSSFSERYIPIRPVYDETILNH